MRVKTRFLSQTEAGERIQVRWTHQARTKTRTLTLDPAKHLDVHEAAVRIAFDIEKPKPVTMTGEYGFGGYTFEVSK